MAYKPYAKFIVYREKDGKKLYLTLKGWSENIDEALRYSHDRAWEKKQEQSCSCKVEFAEMSDKQY